MVLFFDTETTGVPRSYDAPLTDSRNWPRMVQLAWLHYDAEGNLLDAGNHVIRPEGYTIPREASNIHGITTDMALEKGEDLHATFSRFADLLQTSTTVVAHNMQFDSAIIGAEFIRKAVLNELQKKQKICTMKATTDFCRLPGRYGSYKWPKLQELHWMLFDESFEDAHNAATDVQITAKCFWELRRQKWF